MKRGARQRFLFRMETTRVCDPGHRSGGSRDLAYERTKIRHGLGHLALGT